MENIMLSKRNQKQISLYEMSKIHKSIETESRLLTVKVWRRGEYTGMYVIYCGTDKNVLALDSGYS